MDKNLNQIVQAQGVGVLGDLSALDQALQASGMPQKMRYSYMLLLSACPSISTILQQGELTDAEANSLISRVSQATAFTPSQARTLLNNLAEASGIKLKAHSSLPFLGQQAGRISYMGFLPNSHEFEIYEKASVNLKQKYEDHTAALNDLDRLSQEGNAYASYDLGEWFYPGDVKNQRTDGLPYYRRAADLGFGPAYGAMADYALRSPRPNLQLAAKYFRNPTSLMGANGRKWADNASKLLKYRDGNKQRSSSLLVLSVAFTVLACFSAIIKPLPGLLALLLALFCCVHSLLVKYARPYSSHVSTGYTLLVCWLLILYTML